MTRMLEYNYKIGSFVIKRKFLFFFWRVEAICSPAQLLEFAEKYSPYSKDDRYKIFKNRLMQLHPNEILRIKKYIDSVCFDKFNVTSALPFIVLCSISTFKLMV